MQGSSLRQCQCVSVEVDTYHIVWWIIQIKVSGVNTCNSHTYTHILGMCLVGLFFHGKYGMVALRHWTCKKISCVHDPCYSLSLHFNGHFSGGPELEGTGMSPFWLLLKLRMMDVVVTTGTIRRAKLQSNRQHQQTNTQLSIFTIRS